MHLKTRIAALAVVAVTALAGAGVAYACDGGHHDTHGVAVATFTLENSHHHSGYRRPASRHRASSIT